VLKVKASGQWHEATAGYAKVNGKWSLFLEGAPIEDCHIFDATVTAGAKIYLPTMTGATYVNWGDGTVEKNVPLAPNHTYTNAGTYTVKAVFDWGSDEKILATLGWLTNIHQFGLNSITGKRNQIAHGSRAFWGSKLANAPALANLDTSNLVSFDSMFAGGCPKFNTDIGDWDTSKVTNMKNMFISAGAFNQDIGDWDTSKVVDMEAMFTGATAFSQDLSGWCVANIASEPKDFANGAAMTAAQKPKWGTCPGSDPASLTQTAAGTWKVSNFIGTAVYTAGPNATVSGDTITVTAPSADTYINVKYGNGVERRTYISRRQYTYHKENFPYPCGTHECNCREEWGNCHCGTAPPCESQSWGQCGCAGDMCWYDRRRVCDQCTSYCDDWRDVRDGTPAGYTDQFGEWTKVSLTQLKGRKAPKGDGRVELNGLRLTHLDGNAVLMGFFPVAYDSKKEELVNGGVKSASLLITDGGVAEGYWESNFDHDRFALVLMEADGSWGYMLHTDAPEWVQPGMAWQLLGHDLDLNVTVDMSGVVE